MRWLLPLLLALPLLAQPYNKVQMKGSHNSEEREETLPTALSCGSDTYNDCCLNIELDLVQDSQYAGGSDYWQWCVRHDTPYDWKVGTLQGDLMILRNWHDHNPSHDVVTVSLEPKNAYGSDADFIKKIDGVLADTLGKDNIYKPSQLQGDAATLLAGAQKYGWPEMSSLKGKFIVVFTGSDSGTVGERRKAYADDGSPDKLAFVDISGALSADGHRVFCNINYKGDSTGWCKLALDAQNAGGYATRAWVENDESAWKKCLNAGINILATDKVRDYSWATVGGAYRSVPATSTCP